jgi:hydroxyacylglutathione hydrolase
MKYTVEVISNTIFATNSYLVMDQHKNALIVDPSFDPQAIQVLGLKVLGILVTHAHQDHIFSVKHFMDLYGVAVWASEPSKELFGDRVRNLSFIGSENFGLEETLLDIPVTILEDDKTYQIQNFVFKTGIYPGHSIGCTIFDFEEFMLTGDFIFKGTIGRVDWPGSNPEDMQKSLLLFKDRYQAQDMPIYTIPKSSFFCLAKKITP